MPKTLLSEACRVCNGKPVEMDEVTDRATIPLSASPYDGPNGPPRPPVNAASKTDQR